MKNATTNEKAQTIVYIVPHESFHANAISTNIKRRKKVLEKLGYAVLLIEQEHAHFFSTLRILWPHRQHIHGIIIRIDGTGKLDNQTLLKLAMHKIPFIWEIHGFPEEQLSFSNSLSSRWGVWKNNLKRMFLSYLVDACIFISQELQSYARGKIYIRKTAIIPNFIETPLHSSRGKSVRILSRLSQHNTHIVLWGGSGDLPWQAIDVLQKTAETVYEQNKHIVFLFVSSHYWRPMYPNNNILLLHPLQHTQFLDLVSIADVCLALYHDPKMFPFYFFPMKILDYMSTGKPVIATNLGSIPQLIQNGYNGYLTQNAVKDISAKILLLTKDTALSQKFSRNAQKTVSIYFDQRMAQKLYDALLHSFAL